MYESYSYVKRSLSNDDIIGIWALYPDTIIGQGYIYDAPCIYSLSSLPSTMSVNWSLTGDNASNFVLESNTPATNQCRITRISDAEFDGSTNLTLSLK